MGDITLEEGVLDILTTLPKPLQEFLTGPERDAVTLKISSAHTLHADQAGAFQRAFLFMLMGIFTPDQFVQDLKDAGIDSATVSALAQDVNEEVFKPLREKERQGNVGAQKAVSALATPVRSSPAPVSVTPSPTPVPVSSPVPVPPFLGARPQPLTPFNLPVSNVPANDIFRSYTRSVPEPVPAPVVPAPLSIPTQSPPPPPVVLRQIPQTPVPPPVERTAPERIPITPTRTEHASLGGTLRTMATDMQAVNEHREPEPVAYKGTAFTPPILEPIRPTTPAKRSEPVHIPTAPTPPISTVPVTPTPANELIKEYSTDPYREPMS